MLQINEALYHSPTAEWGLTQKIAGIFHMEIFLKQSGFFTFRKARQKIENVPWYLDLCVETVPLSKIDNFYGLNIIFFQSWIQNYQHKIKLYHKLVKIMLVKSCY